jgi:hypothetical protein
LIGKPWIYKPRVYTTGKFDRPRLNPQHFKNAGLMLLGSLEKIIVLNNPTRRIFGKFR